ncbi:MAG: hypothetical protein SGBAC_003187 [Bacillariaceae sp.]
MTTIKRRSTILTSALLLLQQYPLVCQAWSPLRPLSVNPLSIRCKGSNLFKRVVPRKIALPFELSSSNKAEEGLDELKSENTVLRETIRQLEDENQILKQRNNIVLESFEGESMFRDRGDDTSFFSSGITLTGDEISQDELWCDELEDDQCPVEPAVSFKDALRDRAYWLVGLLMMQSFSGIILSRNEALLANHPVIIYFLTMLVGAGGNAGNQASVRVIRGLALGTLNGKTRGQFLQREVKMAASLSLILSVAGFLRAILFKTGLPEAIAVTTALALIVFSSICLGAVLPLLLEFIGVDPAHSSTSIQVVMDILGVVLAVTVSRVILDGPLGGFIMAKLGL